MWKLKIILWLLLSACAAVSHAAAEEMWLHLWGSHPASRSCSAPQDGGDKGHTSTSIFEAYFGDRGCSVSLGHHSATSQCWLLH